MAARDRIRVILDVEPGADPIAGVAVGADGTSRPFCGWTSLADTVAAALDADEEGRREGDGLGWSALGAPVTIEPAADLADAPVLDGGGTQHVLDVASGVTLPKEEEGCATR